MDFEFINELTRQLSSTNIFLYSFAGAKILAFALLMFQVLETFSKDFEGKEPKIGNIMSLFGYGLIIMSSDWIMLSIEDVFAGVDTAMSTTSSDLFEQLNSEVAAKLDNIFLGCEDAFDYMGAFFANLIVVVMLLVTWLIGGLCKLADMSITASYLVQRIFILKFLQFLFPLAVALSTYKGTAKLFSTWILRYIGIFILGIAYIGIINITELLQSTIISQFDINSGSYGVIGNTVDGSIFSAGILVAMILTFTIKIKLFATVTSYVSGMFQ
ncbi:MAG: hypothetical protein KBS61_05250 [Chryseobacterium sp.]|nr:hypothetical protein [Candidatus Chryseobacterium enterohippi]